MDEVIVVAVHLQKDTTSSAAVLIQKSLKRQVQISPMHFPNHGRCSDLEQMDNLENQQM